MITIHYDPFTGVAIPDAFAFREVANIHLFYKEHGWCKGVYSTENVIGALRVAVSSGAIDHSILQFVFKDEVITINEYGAIHNWPDGFADLSVEHAECILRNAMKKREEKRAAIVSGRNNT